VDFYRSYLEGRANAAEGDSDGILSDVLGFAEETRFDVLLAWDLFNYLELSELETLMRRLSRWCNPGALLLALISSQPVIPAEPTVFRILDAERMLYETRSPATRRGPRHNPRDVLKAMMGFEVSSSFLLRNGIQEYVFIFPGGPARR
jgi:hypothetical protein